MLNICFAQQQPEHEPNGLAGRPSPLQKFTKGCSNLDQKIRSTSLFKG